LLPVVAPRTRAVCANYIPAAVTSAFIKYLEANLGLNQNFAGSWIAAGFTVYAALARSHVLHADVGPDPPQMPLEIFQRSCNP
jgi:hypothetical protein